MLVNYSLFNSELLQTLFEITFDLLRFGTNKSRLQEIRNSSYSPIVISEIT